MTTWLILTAALGSAAWLAAWSRLPGRVRPAAVFACLLASPIAGVVMLTSLGWAVPIYPYVSAPSGEVAVLGVKLVPDVAIYVLLDMEPEPRFYILPWDAKQATKLQKAMDGEEGEGQLMLRMKGEFAPGEFYMDPAPQPVLPEKKPEPEGFAYEG